MRCSKRRRFFPISLYVAAALAIALVGLPLPALEAAILDKRLKRAVQGDLTPAKIQKATEIVVDAEEHNLRANPKLLTDVGTKTLETAQRQPELALDAASKFASYRSHLNFVRIQGHVLAIMNVDNVEMRIRGRAIVVLGKPSDGKPPLFQRPGKEPLVLDVPQGAERLILEILEEPGAFYIDGDYMRKFTLVNANVLYKGGTLRLEAAQFVRCNFLVGPEIVNGQNVERFLAAALSQDVINIDLK